MATTSSNNTSSGGGLLDSLLGTLKTDNQLQLTFETNSLLRAGAIFIVSWLLGRWFIKLLNL
ncbi:hypothetical protein GOQ04_14805 [Emticicia sp. ODNR4P]|nr:hypothetical protein [Emticicia sp. ODNR4P]